MFLPRADLIRLTGRKRFSAQRRALDALGIRYTLAATGEPLVREDQIASPGTGGKQRGPNWSRIAA